ncbi:hypothetical protein WIW50_07685 [Flavobacteriaceae bacterium 3-367]
MRSKSLNGFLIVIIGLTLGNCRSKSESKTETAPISNNEFVYMESEKRIELILEDNVHFLVVDKPTKAKFQTKNIDNQRLVIYGSGIMLNTANKDGFRFIITPIEKTLVDGNLEIQVSERNENGEIFSHNFLIPVKPKPK